ncbi:MAG: serine/threonine-protein phosphatase [Chitinophagales bacterium]|nr:serine/threonine-protein phosphatase [Chitinophagales bacterium]OJV27215.1 MAG: hypothetical protein BGO32_04955 [Bacteroidetes bacterium 37-13]HRN94079.1 PP2C family protein-serine/threonine phosphatase [Chitinophagales bacterium]HRP39745.1 PP2C family protein-serine/threonine phosphatase [Chitinophagales bacterium]
MFEIKKQPLTELDFFRQRLSSTERLAATKQQQLNSLLEITEAVNHNMPIYALTKIYENILRAHQGIGSVTLILKSTEHQWACELRNENLQPISAFSALVSHLLKCKSTYKVQENDPEILREFQYIIPVFHKKEPIGFSLVGNMKDADGNAQEEKLKFIQAITNIVAVANENKKLFKSQLEKLLIEKEFTVAEEIQRTLIPSKLPNNEKLEVAAFYKAQKSIGGDYYDLIKLSETEYIFCICDVSGKGVSAALIMANLQANLRILAVRNYPLEQLVDMMNRNMRSITQGEKYCTMFIGLINTETRKLTYVNGGHTSSLLLNGNELIQLDKGCTIIGMFEILPFINVGEILLEKDALILNYTDGLSEATDPDGNLFDTDRIENFLLNNSTSTLADFNKNLIQEMVDFKRGTEYDDDLTLLTLRVH